MFLISEKNVKYVFSNSGSRHPDTKAYSPTPSRFYSTWNRRGVWMCKLGKALNANNDRPVVGGWIQWT